MLGAMDAIITPHFVFYTGLFLIGLGSLHLLIVKRSKTDSQAEKY